jgi:hypothetical protein
MPERKYARGRSCHLRREMLVSTYASRKEQGGYGSRRFRLSWDTQTIQTGSRTGRPRKRESTSTNSGIKSNSELRRHSAARSKIQRVQKRWDHRQTGFLYRRNFRWPLALQAIHGGLPPPVTSVYPFGQEQAYFNPNARTFNSVFDFAPQIRRVGGQAVDRTAFQDPENALISGLIWSHRSIGNFLARPDDFVFVQNQVGLRPIRRIWLKWSQAHFVVNNGQQLSATKSLTNRRTFKISSGFK